MQEADLTSAYYIENAATARKDYIKIPVLVFLSSLTDYTTRHPKAQMYETTYSRILGTR